MPGPRVALLAAAFAGLSAIPVAATVDAEASLPLKARGSLLPAGDSDLLRFRAVAGTALDLSVSGTSGLSLAVEVLDPGDLPVPAGEARITDTGARWAAKGLLLPASGSYALRISGDGAGEYRLAALAKPPGKFAWKGQALAESGPLVLGLAAPAGSRLVLQAKASRGSPALPRILRLRGGAADLALREEGILRGSTHRVVVEDLEGGGDLSLEIGNDAGAAGAIDVAVAVKPPKGAPAVLDLRAEALGQPSGGETWITRIVDSRDTGSVLEEDPLCGCAGAGVLVPGSSWTGEVRIDLVSAPDLPLPGAEWIAAGPAVRFLASAAGPPDPRFLLPYDPRRIPANRTAADVRVLAATGTGPASLMPADAGFADRGSIAVAADGGLPADRTLQAVVLRGTPRVDAGWWGVQAQVEWVPEPPSGMSRRRFAGINVLDIVFAGDGTYAAGVERRGVSFGADAEGAPFADPDVVVFAGSGAWLYGEDGRSILVQPPGEAIWQRMELSADGSAFAGTALHAGGPTADLMFGLRRDGTPPTPASLAGVWNVCGLGYGVGAGGSRLEARISRFTGRAVLAADGTFTIAVRQRDFEAMADDWRTGVGSMSFRGAFSVQGDGSVILQVEDPGGPGALRLLPGAGGRAGLLVFASADPSDQILGVAVREADGAKVEGPQVLRMLDVAPDSASGPGPGFLPDLEGGNTEAVLSPAAAGKASAEGSSHFVMAVPGAPGGVVIEEGPMSATVGLAVDARGAITVTDPEGAKLRGFLAEGGVFGVFVDDPGSARPSTALGVFFPVAGPGD